MVDGGGDGELIAASLTDGEVFSVIFRRHGGAVFRFVARRLGRDEAGDVTGEVFARAFRLRDRFDTSRPSALPWLYGIAVNVVGDRLRRREVRRRRGVLAALRMSGREPDPYGEVDAALDAEAAGPLPRAALRRLEDRDRETLLLFAVEGLSYREIADVLAIPVGTVRSRLSRARVQVRELLDPHTQSLLGRDDPESRDG